MHTATVRFDLSAEPPAESLTCCACCGGRPDHRAATAAMVAAMQPGALRLGDALCDGCADDIIEDVVTLAREQHEAEEQVLLTALQSCACEAWKLWGRKAPEPSIDHQVTVQALENRMGLGCDGFVSLGGAR